MSSTNSTNTRKKSLCKLACSKVFGVIFPYVPAKKGKFLEEAFEISNLLIDDKEDIGQKGYGWLLKEENMTHQNELKIKAMEK